MCRTVIQITFALVLLTTGALAATIQDQDSWLYGDESYSQASDLSRAIYRPPQNITYGGQTYPVSSAAPPAYVIQIRNSTSRYNGLLTGLALWNLGRLVGNPQVYNRNDETCRFTLTNGTAEERGIWCGIMSSFIWEWESQGGMGAATNVSVIDALADLGQSIVVVPGMTCYISRTPQRREVPCGLLQTYTQSSWTNGAEQLTPVLVLFVIQAILFKLA